MTISAPVRDLLQLALGSFPRSQAEKDRSRALLRCAYRGRTRKVRLSIVENCGGPGSGKPGPCPRLGSRAGRYKILPLDEEEENLIEAHLEAFGEESTRLDGVINFPLSKIDQPGKRGATYHADIEKLASRISKSKTIRPIVVVRSKSGSYTLDGDHRVSAFKLLGEKSIPAVVIEDRNSPINNKSLLTNARPLKTDIRIKELAPYLHDLLGDVTKRDAKALARIVKRGVERRWKDSSVARAIVRSTKIEPDRAKVIARTEMSRARTDVGLGKKRDSDKVVFTLGAVDRTCPKCRALEGKVYTVRKAVGVIPVHPNCRCFWSDAPKGARVSNANPKGCNQYSGKECSGIEFTEEDETLSEKRIKEKLETLKSEKADLSKRQYLGKVSDFVADPDQLPDSVSKAFVFYDPEDPLGKTSAARYKHLRKVNPDGTPGEFIGKSGSVLIFPGAIEGKGSSGSLGKTFLHEIEHAIDQSQGSSTLSEFTPRLRQMLREFKTSSKNPVDFLRRTSGRDEAEFFARGWLQSHGHSPNDEDAQRATDELVRMARAKYEASIPNRVSNANPKGCNQYSGKDCVESSSSLKEIAGERIASAVQSLKLPAAKSMLDSSVRDVVSAGYDLRGFDADHDIAHFKNRGENWKSVVASVEDRNGQFVLHLNPSRFIGGEKALADHSKKLYGEGYTSSDSPNHFIVHELGHVIHRRGGIGEYSSTRFESESHSRIAESVSKRAAVNPLEFVSEVFAAKVNGRKFSNDVEELYKTLKGPQPKRKTEQVSNDSMTAAIPSLQERTR